MNNFFLHIIISVCLIVSFTNIKAKEGIPMNILQKKPVFEIKLEAFGGNYVVEINGAAIFSQYNSGGQISTTLPVNHWMRSGENIIKILTWPDEDDAPINPHAQIKVGLQVSNHDNPAEEFALATINYQNKLLPKSSAISESSQSGKFNANNNFEADTQGDVEVYEIVERNTQRVHEFERKIIIPSSLPLWEFFNSDQLPNYSAMNDEDYYQHMDILLLEYQKVQKALESNNIDSILNMFSERNKELDRAFYNPQGTLEKEIKSSLIDAASNSKLELVSLSRKFLDFTIEENNKLIKLSRVGVEPAIVLNYKNGMGSISFDMVFRMKDGKWILTR